MVKLKNPLLSLKASGTLMKTLTFLRRGGRDIAERKPEIKDARSLAQLSWRHMYLKAVALWHALSVAEKQNWESDARPRHMTGFAWFISQCLRPNPGIYLPLQGGKMSGDIDMDGHTVEELADPAAAQDAATKAYVDALEARYQIGARVTHSASQGIPNNTITDIAFDSEDYDTDSIHDNVTNNAHLTCKTAGKYLITAHIRFAAHAVGVRKLYFFVNNTTYIAELWVAKDSDNEYMGSLTTIYPLAVGQYVECRAYQDSGAPLNVRRNASYSPYFMMQRIG